MIDRSPDAVRARRRASVWTKIHPVFAIGQLLTFLVSVVLLALFSMGKVPFEYVHVSVLVKVGLMVAAAITGALWERDVFGYWWFAPEFMLEDAMTVNVFILHIAYLIMAYTHPENIHAIVATLIVAYALYAINVGQYIWRTHAMQQSANPLGVPAPLPVRAESKGRPGR